MAQARRSMKTGSQRPAKRLRASVAGLCLLGFLLSTNGILPAITVALGSAFGAHEVRVVRVDGHVDVILTHHGADHDVALRFKGSESSNEVDQYDPDHQNHVFRFAAGDKFDQAQSLRLESTAKAPFVLAAFAQSNPLLSRPVATVGHAARPPPKLSALLLSQRTIVLVI